MSNKNTKIYLYPYYKRVNFTIKTKERFVHIKTSETFDL